MSDAEAEFLEIFRDEANERLDHIVDALLAVEQGQSAPDLVDALFRDAHTIKGAAGMLGLDDVRTLAGSMEDVLGDVRESGDFPSELVDPLLRAADALRGHVAGTGDPTADLLGELEESRRRIVSGSVPRPAPAPSDSPAASAPDRRTVRVAAEKLDKLLDLVGETVLHRRRLEHALGDAPEEDELVADELGLGDRLLGDLRDAAVQMRTVPLESVASGFPRAVRDIAAAEGKEAELVLVGTATELDRVILAGLADPLVHLLRNAVAHGIEPPDERERAGKPRAGRVELRAEQLGGTVEILVADDGRGVSPDAMAEAAREGSLVDVLARAGFSTASAVTDLAGRGVGLDAVRTQVHGFGGTLEVTSEPGRGTRILLRLPLSLALLDVLLVERGDQVFGVPLASVEEGVPVEETLSLSGRPSLELRGDTVSLADLADLVGAAGVSAPVRPTAIVVSAGGRRVAALCDRLLGQEEVVVKSLGLLAPVSGYLGAAILGDGRVALLLDPVALVGARSRARKPVASPSSSPAPERAEAPKVLVVEDSFTVRELQRSILEAAGYRVETARDGADALERLSRDAEIGLVVTDVEMPVMDGIELTSAIRGDPERSSMPIVIVTSRATDEDRQRGLDAGANAYMVKRSFDQRALLDTVEQLIGR